MARKKYVFNHETLSYEESVVSIKERFKRVLGLFAIGFVIFIAYYLVLTVVLGFDLPKTIILQNKNAELMAKVEQLNTRMDEQNDILSELQMRDNVVYRLILGMDEIPASVRNAGFGGVDRYSYLKKYSNANFLISSKMKLDMLSKKAYLQSTSFDDVEAISSRAGDMASSIPAIYPVSPSPRVHATSSFGYRSDPFGNYAKFHEGYDIAGPKGEPVYATGDGVVTRVSYNYYGYGNVVYIDHGFGYETRYGHLLQSTVEEGQKVVRGQQIALLGSTGRSTGPHLHYEVRYRGNPVNPWNYFTTDLTPEQYQQMIDLAKK
ncbi:MAG: M23 family metallopeptidase [Bacteroidales bacterium]|nr:M23 family metallopeptidase [Bacteroidales bacterium]